MSAVLTDIQIAHEIFPVTRDKSNVLRVGNTRVTLDVIVAAFERGATAEEIAQQFTAVSLADIYGAISYYLHRQAEVKIYLQERNAFAHQMQAKASALFNPTGLRQRLLLRRQ